MEAGLSWTDDRVALLRRLWEDGQSASKIAAQLGGVTRNAVIGKVHRLGLSGRAKSASSSVPRQRKARAPGHMMRASRPATQGNTALATHTAYAYDLDSELETEPVENIVPMGQRRTILELTEETCRWPIGDPGQAEFFFCGGRPITSGPYCSYHSRMAYQPPSARRDRRVMR
jgi:GcrA cell cycle regulator